MRVAVLYNTDYDAELCAAEGVDVSAVEQSARGVLQGIREAGYEVTLIGTNGDDIPETLRQLQQVDLVFNLVESLRGDARNEIVYPALFELHCINYTGATAFGLDLCLHKERCKSFLIGQRLPVPAGLTYRGGENLHDIALPAFLKLAHEDASVGIDDTNFVTTHQALRNRAEALLAKYKQPVIVERFIHGREINATLLQSGGEWRVLPLHEIDFAEMPSERPHIVSYAAKWDEAHVDYDGTKPVPAKPMPAQVRKDIETAAIQAATLCDLRDYCRVDFRIDAEGQVWIIDVNPNCDISLDAGYARAAKAEGIDYPTMLRKICENATGRAR